MKKIGILGLGIGSMYYKILHQFFNVITIDNNPEKNANYLEVEECLKEHAYFDLFIIATPNYLHKEHFYKVIDKAKTILIEKPGLVFLNDWEEAFKIRRNVFMTKNNLWREEFPFIKNITLREYYSNNIKKLKITWINKSRIPSPGSWFTEKAKAYGGTSKDSFPHLLSEFYYIFLDVLQIKKSIFDSTPLFNLTFKKEIKQNFSLDEITDTAYGEINKNGVYDVDDYCKIEFNEMPVEIIGCWKSPTDEETKIGIEMFLKNNKSTYFDLGLCDEYAYFKQFNYFLNIDEDEKEQQYKIDCFIHSIVEQL